MVNDAAKATHLFRIAQEALRNALEHGGATHVTVSLNRDDDGVMMTVRDDGQGFETDSTKSSGSGLAIMSHRASLIGGTWTLASSPGHGTSVTCRIPGQPPCDRLSVTDPRSRDRRAG